MTVESIHPITPPSPAVSPPVRPYSFIQQRPHYSLFFKSWRLSSELVAALKECYIISRECLFRVITHGTKTYSCALLVNAYFIICGVCFSSP